MRTGGTKLVLELFDGRGRNALHLHLIPTTGRLDVDTVLAEVRQALTPQCGVEPGHRTGRGGDRDVLDGSAQIQFQAVASGSAATGDRCKTGRAQIKRVTNGRGVQHLVGRQVFQRDFHGVATIGAGQMESHREVQFVGGVAAAQLRKVFRVGG